jgi:bifunctional UDP-N-acetylglucosamine pyrophosphorylase/glucosamine-1-phosphate N-acetyltransferase/UDP-N-acetylglucosamine pyrophosphorylase
VVVGHKSELVKAEVLRHAQVGFALQEQLLGTGDAVRCALPEVGSTAGTLLILCGDTPLVRTRTLSDLVDFHCCQGNDLTLLAVDLENPRGYGRVIRDQDRRLVCVREEADASREERSITTVNSGIYCVSRAFLESSLGRLGCENAQKEYYLTDIVGMAVAQGRRAGVFVGPDDREVMGVNTLEELSRAERLVEEIF